MNNPITRGRNISYLQPKLLDEMDGEDQTRLMNRVEELMREIPEAGSVNSSKQGLLLGLVQSGKTIALTAAIAMAADNGYRCFIVLTSDNLWLYDQTIGRLKSYLQGMHIEGKSQWDGQLFIQGHVQSSGNGLVLITTKNATVLRSLITALDDLKSNLGDKLPPAIVIDDEADQASLDTKNSKRTRDPNIQPGPINSLISQIRARFSSHTYLQVTATPQALFLQDPVTQFRPEFTIVVEPGKGYVGGDTFFSLNWHLAQQLIRYINQADLDLMLQSGGQSLPQDLKNALSTFFVGATIKYLRYEHNRRDISKAAKLREPKCCFLCHISQKKTDHTKAYIAIAACYQELIEGLTGNDLQKTVVARGYLQTAYNDLLTSKSPSEYMPTFDQVVDELKSFIVGTEVQVLNSDREKDQPRYDRRYNILIGGNKLSRGVTIPNLLVTYYGRKAASPNMDTVLQHARMYGYREQDLDVIRLFVTPEVEQRFRLMNESEQALRHVIQSHPGREYQCIRIGRGIRATRSNVLNPNNVGSYGAGSYYFPRYPLSSVEDLGNATHEIDSKLTVLQPSDRAAATQINIDQAIDLIKLTKSDSDKGGLWNNDRIIASLVTLKKMPQFGNTAYLVVRRGRNLGPRVNGELPAVLGGETASSPMGDIGLANVVHPTLFMYRLTGKKWPGGVPFWVPLVRFPDGNYALMFNFK